MPNSNSRAYRHPSSSQEKKERERREKNGGTQACSLSFLFFSLSAVDLRRFAQCHSVVLDELNAVPAPPTSSFETRKKMLQLCSTSTAAAATGDDDVNFLFFFLFSRFSCRTTMGDSMITPSIEYDYLIKFLALGDLGVGKEGFVVVFPRLDRMRSSCLLKGKQRFSINTPMDNSIRSSSPRLASIFARNASSIGRKHPPTPNRTESICNCGTL